MTHEARQRGPRRFGKRQKAAAIAVALAALVAPGCESEPEFDEDKERNVRPGVRETPRDEEN